MRFAVASIVLALGSSVYAAALAPRVFNCICPADKTGDKEGALIHQDVLIYECAYKHGACKYDTAGVLINKAQDNCQPFFPCILLGQ